MENTNAQGFSFDMQKGKSSIIKVIGVGGGGNNALKHMHHRGIHGVDFVICNTDAQTLDNNPVSTKVQLGIATTEGLGAGADPEVGEKAALESIDDIKAALGQNTKMAFITAGMGGGTGTGAAPIVAKIAKEMGILTVAIVTVPFSFEGKRRIAQAEKGLEELRGNVDSLIVINNDKIRQQFGNLGFKQAFAKADEVLTNAAKGMAEVITAPFSINIDFRDAKSVLENSGTALMSTGIASGEKRAEEAVKKALDSPLLNDNKITGAKDVLLLILSGGDEKFEATMDEIGLINDFVQEEAGGENEANVIFGVGTDEELGESIKVLVIATGFNKENKKKIGRTERIVLDLQGNLTDTDKKVSPFKIKGAETEADIENQEPSASFETQNPFKGDNENNRNLEMNANSPFKLSEEEVEIAEEQEGEKRIDLFSLADEEDEASQGFAFDFENKPEEEQPSMIEEKSSLWEEEKPIEMNLTVKTPAETAQNTEDKFHTSNKVEAVQEVEKEVEKVEQEKVGEFTFIEKKTISQQKSEERRDKLKQFNSRYQTMDSETVFEQVPAFERKNIQLHHQEGSQSEKKTFLFENDKGEISVEKNKFLDKDVD